MKTGKRIEFGHYLVSDPKMCGGEMTFKGTRILVKDVLYFVAQGMDWDAIANEYHGLVSREAIAEAVGLASAALDEKVEQKRSGQRVEKQRRAA